MHAINGETPAAATGEFIAAVQDKCRPSPVARADQIADGRSEANATTLRG